jgi:type II secretion system protein N
MTVTRTLMFAAGFAAIGVVVACGSKSSSEALEDAIEYAADVDLATQPTTEWVGLPMSGVVHLEVHLQHAKADLSKANGTLRFACASGCQLGDDKARLFPRYKSRFSRVSALVGHGLDFGHLAFDSFEIVLAFDHGTAPITTWKVVSADVQLAASGSVTLGRTFGESRANLCMRFGPTPALKQRSPHTAAMLEFTGAPASEKDGLFNIQIVDRLDDPRQFARVCDGSAPPPTARPSLATSSSVTPLAAISTAPTTPSPTIPVTKVDPATAALIASAIRRTSDTTFDIDAKKWSQLWANPTPLAKGARVVPALGHGKTVGFWLYGITPDSPFAHLGLLNRDLITTIAGDPLTGFDPALKAIAKVREAKPGDSVKVTIDRAGLPTTLIYTIR